MTHMNRRDVLSGALKAGAAALVAGPLVAPRLARAAGPLTYVGFGGSTGDFVKKHWLEPFTAETKIPVTYIAGPDLAKVKAQVQSNNVEWDVVEFGAYQANKDGLAEPIDFHIIDRNRFIVAPPSFGVSLNGFVGGIAFDPKRTPHPAKDAAQLWNVRDFPGRRALRNRSSEMLELALLADGVAPANLYPLDVERAFKSLDRIKPNVTKWFAETAQGISLIQTNEVDYTYTYINRVNAAKEAGISIDISLDQNIVGQSVAFVPKGSPRKEEAMRLLEFVTRPQQQALQLNTLKGTSSLVKGIDKLVDPAIRRMLPDPNSPKTVYLNDEYWGTRFVEVDKRFKEWILT